MEEDEEAGEGEEEKKEEEEEDLIFQFFVIDELSLNIRCVLSDDAASQPILPPFTLPSICLTDTSVKFVPKSSTQYPAVLKCSLRKISIINLFSLILYRVVIK